MGEIRVKVRLENEYDRWGYREGQLTEREVRFVETEAVVTTGASMMLLPQDMVESLGLEKLDKALVALANEQRIELAVASTVSITIAGRTWRTDCLVGPPRCEPLVGRLVLERLDLLIDSQRGTVTPRPESPFLPSLKLK